MNQNPKISRDSHSNHSNHYMKLSIILACLVCVCSKADNTNYLELVKSTAQSKNDLVYLQGVRKGVELGAHISIIEIRLNADLQYTNSADFEKIVISEYNKFGTNIETECELKFNTNVAAMLQSETNLFDKP